MPSREFWDERYRSGETPWDYGGVQPEFAEFFEQRPEVRRLLIPGCGTGHEVRAARDAGIEVTGIELSPEAAQRAKGRLGDGGEAIITGDFFTYPFSEDEFDAIYERTFLCAISPEQRPAYVKRMCELLKPGGFLFGFFLFGEESDPPPYPLAPDEDRELFEPDFEQIDSAPSRAPLPFFGEMERWQVWRKRT
ncbi:MAG TPA: methyltransferase domain-containing protein [Opitutales bacterium]|nr:methyltransferase domain-containing protein [Opitutales bacterium]